MKTLTTLLIVAALALIGFLVWQSGLFTTAPASSPSTTTTPFNQTPVVVTPSGNSSQTSGSQNTTGSATTSADAEIVRVPTITGREVTVRAFWGGEESSAQAEPPIPPGTTFAQVLENYDTVSVSSLRSTNGARSVTYYHTPSGTFYIVLTGEPISQARREAESFLQAKLGIDLGTMCLIKRIVIVPKDINQLYAGKNLDFSFCPGAISLQ